MFFRRRAVVVLPLFFAVACGAEATGAAPKTTTEQATATQQTTSMRPTVAGVPPIENWVAATEPESGVSFALPAAVTPEFVEASPPERMDDRTVYEFQPDHATSLTVQFARAPGVVFTAPALDLYLDQVLEGMSTNSGVSAFTVPARAAATVAGRPALNYKVSYTEDGTRWHLYGQLVGEGPTLVSVSNLTNFAPANQHADLVRFLEYHRLMLESVKFP